MKDLKRRVEGLETTEARRRQADGADGNGLDDMAAIARDSALYFSDPAFRGAVDRMQELRGGAMRQAGFQQIPEEDLYRENPEYRAAVDTVNRLRAAAQQRDAATARKWVGGAISTR